MAIKRKTHLNLSGSHHTLDSDNAFVGGTVFVTGSVSASVGKFQYLTGSLSGTLDGNPFLVAGTNIDTVSYNDATGQWTINAHTVSPGTNFFTEIDSTHIYTTSSVALAHLSASQGAEITGSLAVLGDVAFGNPLNSTVSNFSFVNGNSVLATGTYSHAEGIGTLATNDGAHAEGYGTTASGYASHAEGLNTTASGQYSHAEGWGAQAQGDYSNAQGSGSVATGVASHAEGWLVTANGSGSLATGLGTIANGPTDGSVPTTTQVVFGKYNISDASSLFVVGDGTSNANRHDALRLVSGSFGTNMQVTGALNVSGPLSSSGAISAQGNLRIQGNTQLTGAVYLGNTLSASSNISTAGNLFVQGNEQVTGSIFVQSAVSASQGIFTQLTGALSGTAAGLPFLINGGNMDSISYNDATGQWTITGPTATTPAAAGADTQVQFNQNGSFAASSSFTHVSGTLGIRTISGSNDTTLLSNFGIPAALLVNSNAVVTQSFVFFDGVDPSTQNGGTILANGAALQVYSASAGPFPAPLAIRPDESGNGKINVNFDNLINIRPLYVTMSTGNATGTVLSGSLLTNAVRPASIGKLDFNVIAAAQATDDYASFTFSATIRQNQAGSTLVLAATELDSIYEGTNAAGWDVNINNNGDIICTGSAGTVHWYAQVTKNMVLSGSGTVLY